MSEEKKAKPTFYVQQKDIVLPGDLIAEGPVEYSTMFIYKEEEKHYASVPGFIEIKNNRIYLTPIEQAYVPRVNDVVIGIVTDIGNTYWMVDLNSPYEGQLPLNETPLKQTHTLGDALRKYLDIGDYVIVKIIAFDRNRDPLLSLKGRDLGKITGGKIVEVKLSKIAWILGKKKSMIEAIAKETGTNIMVTNNGRIWITGKDGVVEDIAVLAIKRIEKTGFKPPTIKEMIEFIRAEKEKRGV